MMSSTVTLATSLRRSPVRSMNSRRKRSRGGTGGPQDEQLLGLGEGLRPENRLPRRRHLEGLAGNPQPSRRQKPRKLRTTRWKVDAVPAEGAHPLDRFRLNGSDCLTLMHQ